MTKRSFALLACIFVFVSADACGRDRPDRRPSGRQRPHLTGPGPRIRRRLRPSRRRRRRSRTIPPVSAVGPGYAPDPSPSLPAHIAPGPLEVIRESIFGPASKEQWHPLSLSTFFSEGWDEPFVRSPEGTNGAPKQNWTGTADGIFVRFASVNFAFTNQMTTNPGLLLTPLPWSPSKPKTIGNQYYGSTEIILPLNQRFELLIAAPFIASNTTSPTGHYIGNFGDLTIESRFRLVEQRNFSMVAFLAERTPTGEDGQRQRHQSGGPQPRDLVELRTEVGDAGGPASTSTPAATRRRTCTSTNWRSAVT